MSGVLCTRVGHFSRLIGLQSLSPDAAARHATRPDWGGRANERPSALRRASFVRGLMVGAERFDGAPS